MKGRKFIASTRPAEKFIIPDEELCVDIMNVPLTVIDEVDFPESEIAKMKGFDPDAVAFTSKRGADIYFSVIEPQLHGKERTYYGIGEPTCRSVEENGYRCIAPEKRDSEGLGMFLADREKGSRVLLFRSGQANSFLDEILSEAGVEFMNVTAYNVRQIARPDTAPFRDPDCFGVIFTSSMEVEAFANLFGERLNEFADSGTMFFTIGRFTAQTMEKHSIPVSEPHGNSDFEGLLKEICRMHFRD